MCSLLRTDNVPPVLSTEEIASLDPGQRVKKLIEIRFPHHLLPLKLAVTCNGKKFLTKLWPDIGYFLKPLSINMSAFVDLERQLPGMFEYSKRSVIFHFFHLLTNPLLNVVNSSSLIINDSIDYKMWYD